METQEKKTATPYDLDGRPPLKIAIPLGLQHVLAMFVGNCDSGTDFYDWTDRWQTSYRNGNQLRIYRRMSERISSNGQQHRRIWGNYGSLLYWRSV